MQFPDQPVLGVCVGREIVAVLGVGVKPVPRHQLTAGKLAEGLRRLADDAGLLDRAAALGETIRAERGVERVVAVL